MYGAQRVPLEKMEEIQEFRVSKVYLKYQPQYDILMNRKYQDMFEYSQYGWIKDVELDPN